MIGKKNRIERIESGGYARHVEALRDVDVYYAFREGPTAFKERACRTFVAFVKVACPKPAPKYLALVAFAVQREIVLTVPLRPLMLVGGIQKAISHEGRLPRSSAELYPL